MANQGYTGWSLAKLEKEKERIEKAIEARKTENRSKTLDEIRQVAERNGFDLKDLVGGTANGRAKKTIGRKMGKVAPKYRNPNDPDATWSGRGRQPKWVAEYAKKNGNDLTGLLIQ